MQVLVLGNLGDVVKKIYELEKILDKKQSPELLTDLASYQSLLANWPVEDSFETVITKHELIISLDRFTNTEEELMNMEEGNPHIWIILMNYLKCKADVRTLMTKLSLQGKFVGHSISILEIGE